MPSHLHRCSRRRRLGCESKRSSLPLSPGQALRRCPGLRVHDTLPRAGSVRAPSGLCTFFLAALCGVMVMPPRFPKLARFFLHIGPYLRLPWVHPAMSFPYALLLQTHPVHRSLDSPQASAQHPRRSPAPPAPTLPLPGLLCWCLSDSRQRSVPDSQPPDSGTQPYSALCFLLCATV